MGESHIDVVASDVTFTDPDGALEALRRRSSTGSARSAAPGTRSLRAALLACGLELLDEPPGRCRLQHTGGTYEARAVRRTLETIAPFVARSSHITYRDGSGAVWRWRFSHGRVLHEPGELAFLPARRTAHLLIGVRDPLEPGQLDAIARSVSVILDAHGARRFRLQATLLGEPPHAREISSIDCSLDRAEDA